MSYFLLVLSLLSLQTAALDDHLQVKVRPGEDVTLPCQGPRGVNITLLEWSRPELKKEGYVFFYRNRRPYENYHHEIFKGRVELRDPSVKHGDVSVILRNVSVSDTGTYECRIITSDSSSGVRVQSEFKQSINLTVTASGFTDDDTKEREEKDGGDKKIPLSVIAGAAGFLVVVIIIVIVALIICRTKKPSKQNRSYKPPCDKSEAADQICSST